MRYKGFTVDETNKVKQIKSRLGSEDTLVVSKTSDADAVIAWAIVKGIKFIRTPMPPNHMGILL